MTYLTNTVCDFLCLKRPLQLPRTPNSKYSRYNEVWKSPRTTLIKKMMIKALWYHKEEKKLDRNSRSLPTSEVRSLGILYKRNNKKQLSYKLIVIVATLPHAFFCMGSQLEVAHGFPSRKKTLNHYKYSYILHKKQLKYKLKHSKLIWSIVFCCSGGDFRKKK